MNISGSTLQTLLINDLPYPRIPFKVGSSRLRRVRSVLQPGLRKYFNSQFARASLSLSERSLISILRQFSLSNLDKIILTEVLNESRRQFCCINCKDVQYCSALKNCLILAACKNDSISMPLIPPFSLFNFSVLLLTRSGPPFHKNL